MSKVTIVDERPWKGPLVLSIIILVIGLLLAIGGQGALKIVLMISGAIIVLGSLYVLLGSLSSASPIGIGLCVLGFVLGAALILAPNVFSDIMMVVLAVVVILMGIASLMGGASLGASGPATILGMLIAIMLVVAGVLALLNPKEAADFVMIFIGAMMLAAGAMGIYRALQSRH
jgi:hypothetical protein